MSQQEFQGMSRPYVPSSDAQWGARFERQQSLLLRTMEWEARAKPYRGYGWDLLVGFAWAVVGIPMLIIAFVGFQAFLQQFGWIN